MLDPKTISVTVTNDKERDFVCKWFERHGFKKERFSHWPYPYMVANYGGGGYTNYFDHYRKDELTFSSFISQVEPQVGDWVECVQGDSFGLGTDTGAKYKVAELSKLSTYRFVGHGIKEYDRKRFRVCLPPEEKETTGEKEIIGWEKIKDYPIPSGTIRRPIGFISYISDSSIESQNEIKDWPEFWQPIYAPTKPKPITLFLGSAKREFKIEDGKAYVKVCSGKWNNVETYGTFQAMRDRRYIMSIKQEGEIYTRSDHEQLTKAIKDTK